MVDELRESAADDELSAEDRLPEARIYHLNDRRTAEPHSDDGSDDPTSRPDEDMRNAADSVGMSPRWRHAVTRVSRLADDAATRLREAAGTTAVMAAGKAEPLREPATTALRHAKTIWKDPVVQAGVKAGATVLGQHVATRVIKAITRSKS